MTNIIDPELEEILGGMDEEEQAVFAEKLALWLHQLLQRRQRREGLPYVSPKRLDLN